MKLKIWTYGITSLLILSVLLSSCSSPFRILDTFHDGIHTIGALLSGEASLDHSHDFLDLLEHQENDTQHNKYVSDNNRAKIIHDLYIFDFEYKESIYCIINSRVVRLIDLSGTEEIDRPPIS